MDYTTRAAVKKDLDIDDTTDDDGIDKAISAASAWVTYYTGQSFGSATEARRFTATDGSRVYIDPLTNLTGLVVKTGTGGVYGTTLDGSAYYAAPVNAPAQGLAYDRIEVPGGGLVTGGNWPTVEVTATWGYATVPAPIERATRLLATQLYRRKDSPEGEGGTSDFGITQVGEHADPHVLLLLAPYTELSIA